MGSIRKQTIISSILVYIGFLIGAVNIYLYTKNGSFTLQQYGLTKIFFDFGQNMYTFASLGVIPVIYKFYPYYKDNLEDHKIDLITWAMFSALIGFILVMIAGWYFEPLIARKYTLRSKLIVDYYYWIFPFAAGMLFFSVIEGFCWAVQKTIASNFLKETVLRFITTIFILLFYFKFIDFTTFIHLFAFLYVFIFIFLVIYLQSIGKFHFSLTISRVTKKFIKKMMSMQLLIFSGTVIASLAATLDGPIIAGFQSIGIVAIFALAQYVANLIQVPQRSIQGISVGVLSRAWKDKNMNEIFRVYQRSCINLLLLGLFIFGNVWLNIKPGLDFFNVQKEYSAGLSTLLVLSFARIIDAGTGVNGLVIGTSTFWRFDFLSGVILLAFRLPLTFYLIKHYGIIGSAFADLTAMTVYNYIRFEFLRRKFNMQPFNLKTVYSILLAFAAYYLSFYLFNSMNGLTGMILRSLLFSLTIIAGIFYLRLTPDAMQLYDNVMKRWKK